MNTRQRALLRRIALTFLLLAMVVMTASAVNGWLSAGWLSTDWLAAHGKTVAVVMLGLAAIARAAGRKSAPMPSYEERHAAIRDIGEDHPWVKVYLALSLLMIFTVVIGVATRHIDIGEIMGKLGWAGSLALLGLWVLPVILAKLKERYDEKA